MELAAQGLGAVLPQSGGGDRGKYSSLPPQGQYKRVKLRLEGLVQEVEALRDRLIGRLTWWKRTNQTISFLVALTASGSAVAGWSLWQQAEFRTVWVGLSGTAAVLSLTMTHFGIPGSIEKRDQVLNDLSDVLVPARGLLDDLEDRRKTEAEASKETNKLKMKFETITTKNNLDPLVKKLIGRKTGGSARGKVDG